MDHPKEKGTVSEAKVLSELIELGYTVCDPFGDNERYDYIVDDGDDLHKVQVKTARDMENGAVSFNTESVYLNSDGYSKVGYSDIDAFVVYSPDYENIYWIDSNSVPKSSMTIREEMTDQSSEKVANMASEYYIERV